MKFYKYIFLLVSVLLLPLPSYAHPGDDLSDANGCHHCWTNCSNWGLSYGQFHCHNSQTPLPKYYCYTYKNAQTGCKTESDYKNFYDTHVLPLLSVGESLTSAEKTYDYQLQKCKQEIVSNAEYEVKYQECQTTYDQQVKQLSDAVDQKNDYYTKSTECLKKYGSNAIYDQNAGACSCKDGYRINENLGKCVIRDLCNESDSHALTMFNKCLCFSNYLIDPDTKKCTDANLVCKKMFGQNSFYDESSEKCQQPAVVNNTITIPAEKPTFVDTPKIEAVDNKIQVQNKNVQPVKNKDVKKSIITTINNATSSSQVENKNKMKEQTQNTVVEQPRKAGVFQGVSSFFRKIFIKIKFW